MALYFYLKHIRRQMMNKNGKTILGVLYFFHTEKFLWCGNRVLWKKSFSSGKHRMQQKWTNSNSRCRIEWYKLFTNQFLQF